jgi:hypothetical protein
MTVFRAPGGRRMTLPRNRPSAEHNIIQNPSVVRGVQLFTGTRQAHIMPSLSDGLQPVLVTGDIREDPRTGVPLTFATEKDFDTDGANPAYMPFVNPPDSQRVVVLRRFHAYSKESANGPLAAYFYYTILNTVAPSSASLSHGQRTVTSFSGLGLSPTLSYDPIQPTSTQVGWGTRVNGVAAGYLWRKPWFGTVLAANFADEVIENFNELNGPRIVMWPASQVAFGISSLDGSCYFNMWWDEYPLT